MEEIIIENNLSPGDVCVMTAAIKAWKDKYPNFRLGYRGTAPELFKNNPHIDLSLQPYDHCRILESNYPDIHKCDRITHHFTQAYANFFSEAMRLDISVDEFKPDLYMSPEEKAKNLIADHLGFSCPYWVIVAGDKADCPIKGWETERWQEVVNKLLGKIAFVQVGHYNDDHPLLDNVIDYRFKTGIRDLMNVIYHSSGVLCPITFAMHLSAGLPMANEQPRPCVVIAGGREPAHWERYQTHRFLDTIGLLPCCATKACWKSSTNPDYEHEDYICHHTNNKRLPLCMDQITPEMVVFEISRFFRGGVCSPLTSFESDLIVEQL